MTAATPRELSTLDILRVLWRRRVFILIVLVMGMGASVAAVGLLPKTFIAQALIVVEARLDPAAGGLGRALASLPDSATVDTQVQVLTSRLLARRVIEQLGLVPARPPDGGLELVGGLLKIAQADATAPEPAPDAAPIDDFLRRLQVEREGKSNVVAISYAAADPVEAARVANAVALSYVAEQAGMLRDAARRTGELLEQRVAALAAEVAAGETALAEARARLGAVAGRGPAADAMQIAQLGRDLVAARGERAAREARLARLRAQLRDGTGQLTLGQGRGSILLQNLDELRAEALRREAELASSFGERHPRLQDARAERAELERRIAAERRALVEDYELEVETARAQEAGLATALAKVEGEARLQAQEAGEIQALERQLDVKRRLYEATLQRANGLADSAEEEQAGVRLVSPATPPTAPAFPKPPLLLVVGLMVSTVVALFGVYASEAADCGIRCGEQVRDVLGLATLGLVPALGRRQLGGMPAQDFALERPQSPYAEALREVLAALEGGRSEDRGKVVLVTSSLPEEGKSLFATGLARLAAAEGLRVLLIDGDLRRPSLHRLLGREAGAGIAELLKGGVALADLLVTDPRSSVKLLRASRLPRGAALAVDERVARLLEAARAGFDLVLVDSAPVLVLADARRFAGLADEVLFLVRWGKTPAAVAAHCLGQLREARATVAGAVLTRVDLRRHARYGFSDAGLAYTRFRQYYAG
ncbi:MAG TPA: Wzz/FepE/Etk N-terminal domain-containing protein [Geminicoccaceae bacterium]|nr:Wzz/FepE/Etk N-terminal domain-containing protein [Geminicoccaceae bacterium]